MCRSNRRQSEESTALGSANPGGPIVPRKSTTFSPAATLRVSVFMFVCTSWVWMRRLSWIGSEPLRERAAQPDVAAQCKRDEQRQASEEEQRVRLGTTASKAE